MQPICNCRLHGGRQLALWQPACRLLQRRRVHRQACEQNRAKPLHQEHIPRIDHLAMRQGILRQAKGMHDNWAQRRGNANHFLKRPRPQRRSVRFWSMQRQFQELLSLLSRSNSLVTPMASNQSSRGDRVCSRSINLAMFRSIFRGPSSIPERYWGFPTA